MARPGWYVPKLDGFGGASNDDAGGQDGTLPLMNPLVLSPYVTAPNNADAQSYVDMNAASERLRKALMPSTPAGPSSDAGLVLSPYVAAPNNADAQPYVDMNAASERLRKALMPSTPAGPSSDAGLVLSPGVNRAQDMTDSVFGPQAGPFTPGSSLNHGLQLDHQTQLAASERTPMPQIPLPSLMDGTFAAQPPIDLSGLYIPKMPDLSAGAPGMVSEQTQDDQGELARLQRSGSGVDQMLHPVDANGNPTGQRVGFGHKLGAGLLRAAEIAGDFFPGTRALEAAIPGTDAHHDLLMAQQQQAVQGDQASDLSAAQMSRLQAETANLDAQPELKRRAAELAQQNHDAAVQHQQDVLDQQRQHQQEQYRATLAAHGYAPDESDPTGQKTRPLRYDEMSQQQQAVVDLNAAHKEQDDAQAALARAKNDPSSPAYQQAQQRIQVAQRNASTAAGRLGLAGATFQARYYGVDSQGNALPGAMLDDNNNAIGTAFQANVRPTGTERNKGDMANSAADQIGTLRSIVQNRPDIFGPASGRKTDFKVWLGSQDPDAQRFRAARTIAGDHLAGTFGGRSEAALSAIDNAIGQFKDNPAAVDAGLDQLGKANSRFQQAGTVRTAGGKAGNASIAARQVSGITPGGIPAAAAAQLEEGKAHEFGNGQVWTKRNGAPVRLK